MEACGSTHYGVGASQDPLLVDTIALRADSNVSLDGRSPDTGCSTTRLDYFRDFHAVCAAFTS